MGKGKEREEGEIGERYRRENIKVREGGSKKKENDVRKNRSR